MESPDVLLSNNPPTAMDSDLGRGEKSDECFKDLQEQVIANLKKPNVPNVNIPEHIILCLDLCYDDNNSLYRLGDGTTFTSIHMFKRILDFFLYTKSAISKRTEYALIVLKNTEACWVHNFTSNIKDIINVIDYLNAEESTSDSFDFKNIIDLLKQNVDIPELKEGENLMPPSYVVRMIVLYGRSVTLPLIPQEDVYFNFLKKQVYFYIDILFAHEEECALYKCEDVYDALQDLDNGYSYVFEVARNATKIHDCVAKLLAHPLQRPLQKNTEYSFRNRS